MGRLIVGLLILIISVWIGIKIAEDPGYALFAYHHWTAEMPLWFFLLAITIIYLALHYVWRVFASAGGVFEHWRNWLRWRRHQKASSKTNRGLIELIEGRWKSAEHYLLDGVGRSDTPLINYLAAAKAAHEQAAYERRDLYLRKAHLFAPQAEVAIGLTQAQLQLNQGQLEFALATLNRLRSLAPKHGQVLKMLERLYVHLADWNNVLKLLPSLRKAKVIEDAHAFELESRVYCELLKNLGSKTDGLNAVREFWQTIPRKFQQQAPVILVYAQQLMHYSDTEEELEKILSEALRKEWHPELVRVYGLLNGKLDANEQLAKAEKWLKRQGNQPVLLLTLGRLCMRAALWGKARSYFETCLKLEAAPEVYVEYGKLLEQLSEPTTALQCYRDGLVLAAEQNKQGKSLV